jgi:predicted Zn-dependent protease
MTGRLPQDISILFVWLASFFVVATAVYAQSISDEERVGEVAAARILGAAPLSENSSAQSYVNLVGASIASVVKSKYKWRFGLIKTDSVNAFATPGGIVLVTTGLLRELQSEDEFAFVLAHEIAHVIQQHHYRVVLRQRLTEAAAKALRDSSGEASNAALSQASALIYARGLDKASEFEADRIGLELMTQAGFDPAAAISVLERLHRLKGEDPRAELLLSTHPSPADRLDAILASGADSLHRPSQEMINERSRRFRRLLEGL